MMYQAQSCRDNHFPGKLRIGRRIPFFEEKSLRFQTEWCRSSRNPSHQALWSPDGTTGGQTISVFERYFGKKPIIDSNGEPPNGRMAACDDLRFMSHVICHLFSHLSFLFLFLSSLVLLFSLFPRLRLFLLPLSLQLVVFLRLYQLLKTQYSILFSVQR